MTKSMGVRSQTVGLLPSHSSRATKCKASGVRAVAQGHSLSLSTLGKQK